MTAPRLLLLGAPTPTALDRAADALAEQFATVGDEGYAALPAVPRPPDGEPEFRRAVLVASAADAVRRLRRPDARRTTTGSRAAPASRVYLFSGIGDQYAGVGSALRRLLPPFGDSLDHCLDLLRDGHGLDLRPQLRTGAGPADGAGAPDGIHRTAVAQPLLFCLQYALAEALTALRAAPAALAGYSIGEFTAAAVAGVLPPADALRVVVERSRLLDALPPGAMLAVAAPADAVVPLLPTGVTVAALNGPAQTVVSGSPADVDRAAAAMAAAELPVARLTATHAFHSPATAPLTAPLTRLLADIPLRPAALPLLSGATGTWLRPEEVTDPGFWAGHLARTVRFGDVAARLWRLPGAQPVELGPGQALTRIALADPHRAPDAPATAVQLLPGPYESRSEWEVLLAAAGRLWATGAAVDWTALAPEPDAPESDALEPHASRPHSHQPHAAATHGRKDEVPR